MNAQYCEVLYDLTWNLALSDAKEAGGDSRTRFAIVTAWTREFQQRHQKTNWLDVDYLETVDAFFDEKVQGLL